MEQKETEALLLNIYVASLSVLRHDIQPESGIKCTRIPLTHVTKRTSLAANGYEYEKNKEEECFVMGCFKNLCSSQS